MRLIVRLSVRALYCDMALKSSMNMIHSDFQSASALRSISSGSSSSDIASTSNFHRVGTDILSSSDANFDHSTEINSLPQTRVASSIAEMGKEFVGLCDFDCNILHRDLTADKDRLIESALELGITYFIVPGSGLLESRAILDLAKVEKRIALIGTAGVHPYAAVTDVHSQDALKQLEVMVTDAECYAVGECGLDYSTGFPDKEPQIEWFRSQIALAVRYSKPLYLHSRDAEEDFLSVLEEFGFKESAQPVVPCCVHCFTGTTLELKRYLDCGFYVGLTGYIIKMKDEDLLLWLEMITLDRLVIETDAPYMGFKGCRSTEIAEKKRTYPNVPGSLLKVLDRVCAVTGWSRAEVTSRTTDNALRGRSLFHVETNNSDEELREFLATGDHSSKIAYPPLSSKGVVHTVGIRYDFDKWSIPSPN